jgi:hypothetical protein
MEATALTQFLESLKDSIKMEVLADLQDLLDRPYTIAEAAEETKIPASTLYNRIRAGLIEPVVIAGVKRIPSREVRRLKGLK